MARPHVYHVGDRVRILHPRLIRRVGYPLHYKELLKEAREHLSKFQGHVELGFRNMIYPQPFDDLVKGLAKALVLDRGYGGNERSLHYYPIGEPVRDDGLDQLWAVAQQEDDWSTPRPDPTGKIALVEAKYTCKTGTRVPGYSSTDWESGHVEWENGYLAGERTHVILRTNYGDIEACHVEPVGDQA